LNNKPESFASIDREWQSANEEMKRLEESIEQLSRERRRVEGELADHQELLKKYQGQLMLVKNQQQYAAAWKEIDSTRKQVKDLEDADLKVMTQAEGLQTELDQRRAGSAGLQSRWQTAYDAWQHSLADLREEAEQLRARAAGLEAALPERLKRNFQRILKQRQNLAIVAVVKDSCSACRTRVRPAMMQQLNRGDLVHCEGCARVLYLERPSS